jgi:hypothetical protein
MGGTYVKRISCLALLVTAILMAAGPVSANSLDRNGTWTGSVIYTSVPPAGTRALINDGSFELGPPPASAWTEVTDRTCEWIGDFGSAWYVSSWDGYVDFWAGGYCVNPNTGENEPATTSVTQNILIPIGQTTLSFYYIAFRPESDDVPLDGDRAYAAVNGIEVWTLPFTQANNTYPSWVGPITVDLSAFAGQSVALSFGGVSVGLVTGNARIDYIQLLPGATPTQATSWGGVKTLYR